MAAMSSRARAIVTVIAVLAVAQALAFALYRFREAKPHSALPAAFEIERLSGAQAPALDLETEDGARIDWAALRGKPVLVHFWASWCTPCRDELPALLEVARERASALHVLAISLDRDWASIDLFFDNAVPRHVYRLVDPRSAERYGTTALPDTFVVSASGALVARVRGPRDWRSTQAHEALAAWERAR